MYLSFYDKYNKFRYSIEKFLIKLLMITKLSKNNNLIIKGKNKINYYSKKNIYYNKYFNLSSQMIKKITFNFKNFMINKKYNLLYRFSLIEKKKFNLFSLYYYKKNIFIPYIYEHCFEETLIDGPVLFNINEANYNYLNKTLSKLYFYFKWFDNIIFNNKGSFYWFHKDATVCYVGQDNKNNNYYVNSSLDAYNNYYFIVILFIFFPLFILLNLLLSDLLHMYHTDADAFYIRLCETIVYWFFWIVVQFEFLDKNIITMIFAIMENHTNNIEHRAYIDYYGVDTIFNYEKLNKKIFPLYLYYKREFILTQMYHLREEESNSVIFIIFNMGLDSVLKIIDNAIYFFCNIFDIIYIKINIVNFYSQINSIYCIFKCFIYIYFIYWLKFKQKNKLNEINKFYLFHLIYFDLFNFSNKIINNYYNNVKIYYNNIIKK